MDWQKLRQGLFKEATKKSKHKHSEIVNQITGTRLEKYTALNEIEYALEKRFAPNIQEVLKVDDLYLTLSQCSQIEQQDIDRKISEAINK